MSNKKAKLGDEEFKEVHELLSLRKVPSEIQDLTKLTKLDLPKCNLSKLPDALPHALPNLSILFLSNNDFVEVPPVIGTCKNLQASSSPLHHGWVWKS